MVDAYDPPGHNEHDDDASKENEPVWHKLQEEDPEVEKEPAWHT